VVLDLATTDVRIDSISTNLLRSGQAITLGISGSPLRRLTNVSVTAGEVTIAAVGAVPISLSTVIRTNGYFELVVRAIDDRGIETISVPVSVTVRPGNDRFLDRGHLTANRFELMFSPAAGTLESGEKYVPTLGLPHPSSTWWSWSAAAGGPVRLQVESQSSPVALGVFTGSSLADLTLVQQNLASGILEFEAEAGRTYQIRVWADSNDTVPIALSMRRVMFTANPLANGSVRLNFDSLDEPARIEYSSDLLTWKRAEGDLSFNTWIDAGPPITDKHPAQERVRFYRLVIE
jgi:hypothetical protein